MNFIEALGKLNAQLTEKKISPEDKTEKINKITQKLYEYLEKQSELENNSQIAKTFKVVLPNLSSLIDILYYDSLKAGTELQYVSSVLTFFLNKSPKFLRKVKNENFYEGMMLVACKLFSCVRQTLDSISPHTGQNLSEDVPLLMEIQYLISEFFVALYNFRKKSFRKKFLIPELFNSIGILLERIVQFWDEVVGYYVNSKERRIDLRNILVVLKQFSKDDYCLIKSFETKIKAVYEKFASSGFKKLKKMQKFLADWKSEGLDLKSIPVTRIREYEPKIFDVNDRNSEYNQKFRTKLLREKVKRMKKNVYRDLATDAKLMETGMRKKQTMIEKRKKKKYGELMRYIQEQNEELKKERTTNVKVDKRKKKKRRLMAGAQMDKNSHNN